MNKGRFMIRQLGAMVVSLTLSVGFMSPMLVNAQEESILNSNNERTLTEEQIAYQKSLQPRLSEIPIEEFNFAVSGIQPFSVLPARYDGRELGILSSVRNQGVWGTCWVVSSADVAGINDGLQNNRSAADYSEAHLAYFFYNRVNDPLGHTAGDKNIIRAGGNYLTAGGNALSVAQALATWGGLSNESVMPYEPYSSMILPEISTAYQNQSILKNTYFLNNPKDVATRGEMKRAIQRYGAVVTSYFHNSDIDAYINWDTSAYYNPVDSSANHAVAVVGWDDNYSKTNFNSQNQPSSDGAWIVKNSWSEGWGDNGYFYMSYENPSYNPVVFEVQPADTYDHNYQYDGTAGSGYLKDLPTGVKISNIYKAEGNITGGRERLDAVSMALYNSNISYTIQIYKNLTDLNNPESGMPLLSVPISGQVTQAGIQEVKVGENIYLNKGESYSVVIQFQSASQKINAGVEMNTPYYQAEITAGQSYLNVGGRWQDLALSASNVCARIKAFTSDIEQKSYTVTFDGNGGKIGAAEKETKTVFEGTQYALPKNPARTGYSFKGWYSERVNGRKLVESDQQSITANQTWYAQWSVAVDSWKKSGNGKWWYQKSDGSYLHSGWHRIGAKWYSFDDSGWMRVSWQLIGGKWYYLGGADDGVMREGWQKVGTAWYYFGGAGDGKMRTGWQKVGTAWYYFGGIGDGKMRTGWQTIEGKRYYFNSNGVLV